MVSRAIFLGVLRSLFVGFAFCVLMAPVVTAQASLDELRNATFRQPTDLNAWVDLGNAYLERGQFDDAQKAFLEAVSLDYRSDDAHFGLGLAEFERGDYPAALFQFNEVTRLFPERFDGHFNEAVTLVKLRRFDEAAAAFREAIENSVEASSVEKVEAYRGLAGQLKRIEDYAGAADAYGAALEIRPNDNELTFLQAEALYQAGMGLEALPSLSDLEARTDDHKVSVLIANIYVQAEQDDYAVSSLQRALRNAQATSNTQAQGTILVKLGLLQSDLGREAEATSAFQRASAADTSSWEARYNLGVNYLERGQPESAIGYLQNAITINPESGAAYLALATAYDQVGQLNEAFSNAEAAQSRLEDPLLLSQANFIVGRGLYRQGNYEASLEAFEGVVEAQPDNAAAQLWAGLAQYGQANYDEAVQFIERSVQLDPESLEARVNLGAAYLASERYQDAELVYQLLVEDSPNDADSHYNLGWSLLAQNQLEAAKESWVRASDLGYEPAQDALQRYF